MNTFPTPHNRQHDAKRPSNKPAPGIRKQHMPNKVSKNEALTEAQLTSITKSLDTINNHLDFLIGLTPEEVQRVMKMGNKSRSFVEDAIKIGIENPGMLPRTLDPEELGGKLVLTGQLRDIHRTVSQLNERLHDTLMVAGADLFDNARLIYKLTKTKVKPEGLIEITGKIGKRFAGQGNRKVKNETTQEKAA
jgi:hypothetical protein